MLEIVSLIKRLQPMPKSSRWEDYFQEREELLWSASPAGVLNWTWGMIGLSIFGVPFLLAGLATFFIGIASLFEGSGTLVLGTGVFMMIFSLPFISVGLGLTVGTWVMPLLAPHFVRYAVTDKRAYIAKSWWTHKMESHAIDASNTVELREGKTDTVYFTKTSRRGNDGKTYNGKIGFLNIEDGAAVYKLLRNLQQKAKT
ncbi:hypothetical protein [Yoonia sp. MH D7]